MFYYKKTPWFLRKLYPNCLWRVKTDEKCLYLTFDDGPCPGATDFVLDELSQYSARATFFCIGKNVKENFSLYKKIIEEGHRVGNHTYNHMNGWKVSDKKYLEDIRHASLVIDTNLFRPPYGKISKFQVRLIQNQPFNLNIVMWDILSGDFDVKISEEKCFLNVVRNTEPGSIIVFHDSLKSLPNLTYALPRVLKYYSEKGFQFKTIP
jgi:peptidoglycan-N-acetylglucosamine deacetylase